jgi:hypothetical protein
MKMKLHLSTLLLGLLTMVISFQSCDMASTTDAKKAVKELGDATADLMTKSHSEMNVEEQAQYVALHADHFAFISEKREEIFNEHILKKDHFNISCESGEIELERLYNDNGEIHLLTYTVCKDNACSTKSHTFWEGKLIYQMYHHSVEDGQNNKVDDHQTFFKDGKIIKCLEKKYSYMDGEVSPKSTYEQVDCVPADKLTKDIEKLLTLTEEEAKAYLCK